MAPVESVWPVYSPVAEFRIRIPIGSVFAEVAGYESDFESDPRVRNGLSIEKKKKNPWKVPFPDIIKTTKMFKQLSIKTEKQLKKVVAKELIWF